MSASVTTGRPEAFEFDDDVEEEEGGAGGEEAEDMRRAMGDDRQMRIAGDRSTARANEARDGNEPGMIIAKRRAFACRKPFLVMLWEGGGGGGGGGESARMYGWTRHGSHKTKKKKV